MTSYFENKTVSNCEAAPKVLSIKLKPTPNRLEDAGISKLRGGHIQGMKYWFSHAKLLLYHAEGGCLLACPAGDLLESQRYITTFEKGITIIFPLCLRSDILAAL